MKSKRQQIIKKLDYITSKIVRLKWADNNWNITCISCWKKINYKLAHCCHFIDRWCLQYRFDFDNLRPWCAWCNTYRPEYHIRVYTLKLIDEYWLEKVKEMQNNSKKIFKISIVELEELLEERKKILKKLIEQLENK